MSACSRISFVLFGIFFALGLGQNRANGKVLFEKNALGCPRDERLMASGRNLYRQGQFLQSSFIFAVVATSECEELIESAKFAELLAMNALGESQRVHTLFNEARSSSRSPEGQRKYKLLQAFLSIETGKIPDDLSTVHRESLLRWKNRELDFPVAKKEPWIAALGSSIIPGMGQAYVGSYQSALISFLLNSLFLSTTLEFSKKGMPAAAGASGLVFSVVYLGNILNSAESAVLWNRRERSERDLELRNQLFPELVP